MILSTFSIRTLHKCHVERLLDDSPRRPYYRGNATIEDMQQRKRAKLKLRDSCDGCSEAKIKCNKEKPVCSRCNTKRLTCCYGPSHRSGRRSNDASKASERSWKSPPLGLAPRPTQVAPPASQAESNINEIETTAALNAISNTEFNFSIDAFNFPEVALDGAASETTPFTMFPELLKTNLSAPEYDVAAFMSSNPDALNHDSRKSNTDNSNSGTNDNLTYDIRNDSIGSDIDSMTYDTQWLNSPSLIFRDNSCSGLGMPPSSSYTPQMTLPEMSTPASLQSSIFNHQSSTLSNTNAISATTPSKASCTCLTQALGLLAALHGNINASSSACSTPPLRSPQMPPYFDNSNNNTTSLRNLVGGGMGVKDATTLIHESLALNTTSLQKASAILSCACSTHNQQLIFFVAFIALKTMDRYTAAAQWAVTLDHDSGGDGNGSSRALAQLVLGELHRVVRIVDTLSKRMGEGHGRQGSSSSSNSGSSSQSGGGGYDISASCFAQLENDLRKHLKALTNDAMAVLRRE